MLFSPRIGLKSLANLCRRLAISTAAGIQDRKIWSGEADRAHGRDQATYRQVSDALARGVSIGDAVALTGDYLPTMFKQIVAIGDTSGTLDQAYRRLAEHYEHSLAAKRSFLSALAWPMIQLGIAVMVIGIVIWISSTFSLKNLEGEPADIFGLGLTGRSGLMIYIAMVATAIAGVALVVRAGQRGVLWTRRLQRSLLNLPAVGDAIRTLALARFTWALQLVLDTSMDLRKALPLALDASGNDYYRELGPKVANNIQRGMSLHMALAETHAFPGDLLDAMAVGEETGMLAETMQRQSAEFQRRAATAISVIAQMIGYAVWAAVAVLIIVLIFRVFMPYVDNINNLSRPNAF